MRPDARRMHKSATVAYAVCRSLLKPPEHLSASDGLPRANAIDVFQRNWLPPKTTRRGETLSWKSQGRHSAFERHRPLVSLDFLGLWATEMG